MTFKANRSVATVLRAQAARLFQELHAQLAIARGTVWTSRRIVRISKEAAERCSTT